MEFLHVTSQMGNILKRDGVSLTKKDNSHCIFLFIPISDVCNRLQWYVFFRGKHMLGA